MGKLSELEIKFLNHLLGTEKLLEREIRQLLKDLPVQLATDWGGFEKCWKEALRLSKLGHPYHDPNTFSTRIQEIAVNWAQYLDRSREHTKRTSLLTPEDPLGLLRPIITETDRKLRDKYVQDCLSKNLCPDCFSRSNRSTSKNKRIFADKGDALDFDQKFSEKIGAFHQVPYVCPRGYGWHLGSDYRRLEKGENLHTVVVTLPEGKKFALSVTSRTEAAVSEALRKRGVSVNPKETKVEWRS
jgi:hypothetical protein